MPLHYFMDIYHRPKDESEPVLWRATRIVAQDDAEAIREAEASFRSCARHSPSLIGFSVRRIGFRRAGDRIIHTKNTASAAQQSDRTPRQEV
jgi:hypothetical protein